MASEKNKKTKEPESAEAPIGTANAVNQPEGGGQVEKPKRKGCLTCGIIATVVVVLIIVGFIGISILSFWFPPTFLFGFLSQFKGMKSIMDNSSSSQKGTLKGKNLAGLIDPSKTVTKRISAKNGGQITARTASGLYYTVDIGPGSLEKDTDISITPIDESPIENYPDTDDPGVVIGPEDTSLGDDSTITVSEDPPAPEPGDPGADPGTNPDGDTTTPPGTPPETPPDTPPGTPPGTSGDMPSFEDLADLLGRGGTMTTPPGTSPGQGGDATGNTGTRGNDRDADSGSPSRAGGGSPRFSDKTVIIFVGYGGGVNPVPTDHPDEDGSATGPIDQTGGTTVDDPDEEESEDLADNAAEVSGGTCSPEFMQAMASASQAGGAGSSAAQAAIRDCLNTEWLNNLCVNDPVKLRRTHFEQRLAIARRFDAEAASVIESLMNQCQARYRFGGEGINPESNADVTIFSSFDATVCGYIDDEWTAHEVYRLSGDYATVHSLEGTGQFRLPSGGGSFAGSVHGDNAMTIIGTGITIPNIDPGFQGNFDGVKTIQNLYLMPSGVNISSAPIELQERQCVPIAPLPRPR